MTGRRRALALAAVCALAACGGAEEAAAPELSVSLKQYRKDQLPRVVQLAVTAPGGATVIRAQLRAPGFAEVAATDVDAPVVAGQTVDVPVPYGAVQCEQPPGVAQVALRTSGSDREVVVAAQDPSDVLRRVHDDECRVQGVLQQVSLALAPTLRPSGGALVAEVVLRRVSGRAAVQVRELQPNTLFTVTAPALALLRPDGEQARQVLVVRSTDPCNAHNLGESKRATVFGLSVSVAGAEPVLVSVSADAEQRRALLALASAGC